MVLIQRKLSVFSFQKKRLDFKVKAMKTQYVHFANCYIMFILLQCLQCIFIMSISLMVVFCTPFACSSFERIVQATTNEHIVGQVMIRTAWQSNSHADSFPKYALNGKRMPLDNRTIIQKTSNPHSIQASRKLLVYTTPYIHV